jgi:hypothetical protein
MKMYKVVSGDKLNGSVIDEDHLQDLIVSNYFEDGTEVINPTIARITFVIRDCTLQTWKGRIMLPKKVKLTKSGVPETVSIIYHKAELPAFDEVLKFEDAPKWLKRACRRIVFHWVDDKKKPHKHVFEPTSWACEYAVVGSDNPKSWVATWAWNSTCHRRFNRFDQDLEENTVGMNSTEREKERHHKLYQAKKNKGE